LKVDFESVCAEFNSLAKRVEAAKTCVETLKDATDKGLEPATEARRREAEPPPELPEPLEEEGDGDAFGYEMHSACAVGAPAELEELSVVMAGTRELVAATAEFFGERPLSHLVHLAPRSFALG